MYILGVFGRRKTFHIKICRILKQYNQLLPFTETAVNIGYSAQLLTDDMVDVFVVDGYTSEDVEKQLIKYQDAIKVVNTFHPPSK